jgi:hypothetical protein
LSHDAGQFIVIEAKMFSELSKKVTNASYYHQAARSVACMAETLRLADRHPSALSRLGFYVSAPASQLKLATFTEKMNRASIQSTVERRVEAYGGEKDDWYTRWFQPTFQKIEIRSISWEELLETIAGRDAAAARSLNAFYEQCIQFSGRARRG